MAGSWRRDVELPSISRQSLPAMLFPASTPEPADPSWPGWLLCAGGRGAGVGEAAGALAHSGGGWQLPRSPELTAVAESTSPTCQGNVRHSRGRQRWGSHQISFFHAACPQANVRASDLLASNLPEPHPPVPIAHFLKNSFIGV